MNDIGSLISQSAVAAAIDRGADVEERRLNLLRQIANAGGTIAPSVDPYAKHGYVYALQGDDVERDLEILSARNYVETRFLDRVSLCPKCDSHHLNVREICPGCRLANLSSEGLLHHFACGYVGLPSEFSPADDGSYRCPKCNRRMHHLGTEFDRLGKAFHCRACGLISENPPVEALCLACGAHTPAESLVSTVVFSYALTSRGAAAVRRGSLFDSEDDEPISVSGAPVYRRKLMLEFLDHELKRLERFNVPFSLLLVQCPAAATDQGGSQSLTEWLIKLRGSLRDVDLIGQLGDALYVAILPQTGARDAKRLCERIAAELGPKSPVSLSSAEITAPRDLARVLPGLTARAEL